MCLHGRGGGVLGQKDQPSGNTTSRRESKAITQAPAPKNVSEVRSYLGMINYYQNYLPNLSTILALLHGLLEKGKTWQWTMEHQESFTKSKELLKSSHLLVHYDTEKDVLSHRMPDNTEQPIAFASRSFPIRQRGISYSLWGEEILPIRVWLTFYHTDTPQTSRTSVSPRQGDTTNGSHSYSALGINFSCIHV